MAPDLTHIIVFPWLAFGHMIPFLELSKRLASKGIQVTIVSTPRNAKRLPPVPHHLAKLLKFVEFLLPTVEGLPHNAEATVDLKLEQVQFLKKSYDQLKDPLRTLLEKDSPDLIVFDFVPFWVAETARSCGVPCAYFSVFSASALAYIGPPEELSITTGCQRTKPEHLTRPPGWFDFPSLVSHRPAHAERVFRNINYPDESGLSTGQRLSSTFTNCDLILVRSCTEFEMEYLDLLEKLHHKPILPIGLLPPKQPAKQQTPNQLEQVNPGASKWLDVQKETSVLFVGFGSEHKMPIQQIHELAHGIERSELPFIWLLKELEGYDGLSFLPTGFLDRTTDRGVVFLGWAPQAEILAHPAIGGCLFHSGWGSIIESLQFGHPLIVMPMMADQGLNARLLQEKGLAYEVQMNEDGSFNGDKIAKSIRLLMVQEEGAELRIKASQTKAIFADQDLHDSYINIFLRFLSDVNATTKKKV